MAFWRCRRKFKVDFHLIIMLNFTLYKAGNIHQGHNYFSDVSGGRQCVFRSFSAPMCAQHAPTSPCILVRSVNHYTIRDHHAGNVAVWIVKLVNAWKLLGPMFLKCKCGLIHWRVFRLQHKAQMWSICETTTSSSAQAYYRVPSLSGKIIFNYFFPVREKSGNLRKMPQIREKSGNFDWPKNRK